MLILTISASVGALFPISVKDMRLRVAKALFYAPKAIERANQEYRSGEVDILNEIEKLEPGAETATKDIFTKLERFITRPRETYIKQRGPRKEL